MASTSHAVRYAGVLPYAHDAGTGRVVVLLGEEASRAGAAPDAHQWSDFGGLVDAHRGERVRDAAAREAYEESMGFLGASPAHIAAQLSERRAVDTHMPPSGADVGGRGRTYLLRLPWPPCAHLESAFVGARRYVRRCARHVARARTSDTDDGDSDDDSDSDSDNDVVWCPEGFMEKRRVRWVPLERAAETVPLRAFFRDATLPALRALIARRDRHAAAAGTHGLPTID